MLHYEFCGLINSCRDPWLHTPFGPLDATLHSVIVAHDKAWKLPTNPIENFTGWISRDQCFLGAGVYEGYLLL